MKLIYLIVAFFFIVQAFSQEQPNVDFTHISIEILPILDDRKVEGSGSYEFVLSEKTDSIFLDAVSITFNRIELNGEKIDYSNNGLKLGIKAPENTGKQSLKLDYTAKPRQTIYFIGLEDKIKGNEQVWTQGQGKYTSHWLPSLDDMNDKMEFDLSITADKSHQVIANGILSSIDSLNPHQNQWKFDMTKPMSSYLAAFVIGDFDKKTIQSKSGVPIELYYESKDSLKVEPTYRYTKEIFDFLEEEIGVPYPWQNYKQVPVQDFLYAGMENTGCTIFSNQYVIDSTAFVDKNYVNVNAHELAHQWFGNMVTEQSGNHHWLHEGFATYYAYLAEKELFGEDHFYWKLFDMAKTLHNLSENGDGEALTNPNANSLTFYEKGAWALLMLRRQVGSIVFKKGIKAYLNKHAFKNVTIEDFLKEMEIASGQNLDGFKSKWLESEVFPWEEALRFLKDNSISMRLYLRIEENRKSDNKTDKEKLRAFLEPSGPYHIMRQSIIDSQGDYELPKFEHNFYTQKQQIKLRQTKAISIPKIPLNQKYEFESMLYDKSYVTQETVLFKLWEAFPDMRFKYLDTLDGVVGLPNKNVRLLWLTLALVTPDYQSENKKKFYDELNGYTASQYNFEVRQLAFQYLFQIQALSDDSIKNLIAATDHYVWQFKKSSRNLIRDLATTDQKRFENVLQMVSDEEQYRIKRIIVK